MMYLTNNSNLIENLKLNVDDFISNKVENDNSILIASTEKLSQKYNLILLRKTERAFHNSDIYSFSSFIKKQYKNIYGGDLIDEIIENELVIQSLERCKNLFQGKNRNYNYITQISSIIKGLREDGIRAKNLKEDLFDKFEKYPHDTEKLSDLVQIMESYEYLLTELGAIDVPLAMEHLIQNLNENKIISNKELLFTNFINFRKPDIELIEALSNADNSIVITTNTDIITGPYLGNENFFLNDLKEIGFKLYNSKNEEIDFKIFETNSGYESSTIRFAENKKRKFNIISYFNIREEVYAVTKLVKYLLLDENYKLNPSDICVVSRDISAYSLLIGEFFTDNKIPVNNTDRLELSKSPVVIGIINVLECVLKNYSIESISDVLDSAFLNTGIKNPKHILHLAKKYRITNMIPEKGLDTFITLLSMRIQNIENSISSQQSNNLHISQSIFREKEELEQVALDFSILNQKFSIVNKSKEYTVDEFINLLHNIINTFDVRTKSLELNDWIKSIDLSFSDRVFYTEKIEKDSRALYKFLELLKKLKTINLYSRKQKYSLSELLEKLKGIISITRYQIREKKGFGVDVTSLEQTRGYDYKVKILVGASEGILPVNFQTDRLIGKIMQDSERRHYFQEYIQFFEFFNDDAEYYIFSHREENSELKLNSHFITPIENDKFSNIYSEESGLTWQNSIINIREQILNGQLNAPIELIKKSDSYRNSKDLEINLNKLQNKHSSNHNTYSDSAIEDFKARPYNYFYQRLLKIENLPEVEIFLTPMEIGSIIHKSIEETFNIYGSNNENCILKTISSKSNSRKLNIVKLTISDKPHIIRLFKITSLEKIRAFQSQHQFYDIDELLLIGNDNQDGILLKWFENIIDRHITDDYCILANEFQFNNIELKILNNSAKFSGKIDRIDINSDLTKFKITDYKSNDSTRDGLQLVIYCEAVRKILLDEYGISAEPSGLIYDSFRYKHDAKELRGYQDLFVSKKSAPDIIVPKMEEVFKLIEQIENYDFIEVKEKLKDYNTKDFSIELLKRD